MKLWTIQKSEVLDILERDGAYRTNTKLCENAELLDAYDWLNTYLEEKDAKPEDVDYPIWAWYRHNSKEKKPDLRRAEYDAPGTKCVCLELEVPDEKVLLSDYDNWHAVLNQWWLDDSKNEEEWDKLHEWYDRLPLEERKTLMEKSWEKIFDIELREDITNWNSNGEYVQAVFWELKKEYVKKVQYFTAR